jgi:hypothetical protein
VARERRTVYVNDVNFGRPWREDFTVTIAKRKAREFAAAVSIRAR